MMLRYLITSVLIATSPVGFADDKDNAQCEMIANLAADYFSHKQSGKSLEQVQKDFRPQFGSADFQRMVDLAIQLAYAYPLNTPEPQIVAQVYDVCERHQPPPTR